VAFGRLLFKASEVPLAFFTVKEVKYTIVTVLDIERAEYLTDETQRLIYTLAAFYEGKIRLS
jgi:hypothetical protein